MSALVIYESMFGNTKQVATAIVEGIASRMEVLLREVSSAPEAFAPGVDLVVVGAPTHAFGLSRPSTRADAARQVAGLVSPSFGVREWLAALDPSAHVLVATFDTRVNRGWIPGAASRTAARLLRRRGFTVADQTSFLVDGMQGPLAGGELDRAREWGRSLAETVIARTPRARTP